jgi:hypothetical protein
LRHQALDDTQLLEKTESIGDIPVFGNFTILHAEEILLKLGYKPKDIVELEAQGVIKTNRKKAKK